MVKRRGPLTEFQTDESMVANIHHGKKKKNTSPRVSVFAAEGQVDDLLSQRVHP